METTDTPSTQEPRPAAAEENAPLQSTSMFLATLCAVIWAGQSVAVKVALEEVPPLLLMASRFILALPLIYVIGRATGVKFSVTWQEQKTLSISALLLCIQIMLYTVGTHWTSSIHSIILINVFPFFTILFARVWLPDTKLNVRILIGLCIAFAGIVVIAADRLHDASFSLKGDLLVVGAAVVMGAKIVYMKRALRSVGAVKLVLWDNLGATMLLFICGVTLENWSDVSLSAVSWLAVVYQGVAVSAVAFLIWVYLISRHSPNELNAFRMATPPLGAVLGAMLLAEPLSAYVCVSLVCVCLGIYCVLT